MRRLSAALAIFLPSSGAMAQSYVVSPRLCERHEGPTSAADFALTRRIQHVTGDLRGTARMLNGIAWRRDGQTVTSTSMGVRTLDLEILCADTDRTNLSTTFANNYVGQPTRVVARKMVTTPDLNAAPVALPAPWSFNVAFDAPYGYLGAKDLLYELVQYGSSASTSQSMDAATYATTITGGFAIVGQGCTTANGTMALLSSFLSVATDSSYRLGFGVTGGPGLASGLVLLGATDPGLAVPGLCPPARLRTDAGLLQMTFTTSAGGAAYVGFAVPFQASVVDLALTAQAVAFDSSQGPLGLAASNGVASLLPPLAGPMPIAMVDGTIRDGFGMVTRFRY